VSTGKAINEAGSKRSPRKARAADVASAAGPGAGISLGHLDQVLGYALRQAQIAVFKDFRRTFADFDIRPTQYAVLSILSDHPGLKQGDVSHALGIKRTNFVAVLDELERRGLARRSAMADDRRSRALHLTEAGAALTKQLRAVNAEHEARLAALLPPGQAEALIALLRQLTIGIGPEADEA
jgi:DNA-binding MarR family transcriptional regulator